MAPKQAKKTLWVDCERCGCIITSNDKTSHSELNCGKDQVKCPYVEDGKLYTWLERSVAAPDNAPKDAVMLHPSAASLISAVIGCPLLLSREGAPTMVKRMWPSKSSAPAAVILPAAELSNAWSNDNKTVTVSVFEEEIPKATRMTIRLNNHKTEHDICDILKHSFFNNFVSIGCILVYYYFGKKLEIEVIDLKSDALETKEWYVLSENTTWIMEKETAQANKKKVQYLGGVDNILEEIQTYIKIAFNADEMAANFQPTRGLLLHGHSGVGKTAICKYIINCFNCFHVEINGTTVFSKYFGETENMTTSLFDKAVENQPSIIFVDEIETICPKRSSSSTEQERRVTSAFVAALDRLHEEGSKVFILATTRKPYSIDPMLRRFGRLDKEIEVPIPDRIKRKEILYSLLKSLPHKVSQLDSIADLAHGYVAADLVNLCTQASMKCIKRSSEFIEREDLMAALTIVRPSAMRELLIEVPNVRWTDIGGQADLKLKLRQAVEWPLKHADSFRRLGIKPPSGVLLYGPPGCSKTMIAKALATESGLNFLSIKGPELFSKWIGDSERAVRDLFTKARQVAPSIIFFDEMDAIGSERGASAGDSGVHQRVLAQLLTELDGVVPLNSVTILAATNRPDMMDRALLRPGRLDRLIYVPLPDFETRLQIIELNLAKMSTSDDANSHNLAARTEGFSGAELQALCHEAALKALENDLDCAEITMEHFERVLCDYKPRTPQYLLDVYEQFALGQRSG
ncbi:ATPase family gene 2 protein homolog A [Anticarsia gemmatalis]|uniref:ATPase family gene 2 protein homolog A n=1 Tax=Anticarsia gemmatalis TaxID=129554 RepID=UPI003F75C800